MHWQPCACFDYHEFKTSRCFISRVVRARACRKRDYETASVTIRGLLRVQNRPSKPPKTEVASSSSSAAKGNDSPNLFAAIPYPSDEDEDYEDDEKDQDEMHPERRPALHTKDGRAVDKLRLLAVGVAYILKDYEMAYAIIRDVCELHPSSVRPERFVQWLRYSCFFDRCVCCACTGSLLEPL